MINYRKPYRGNRLDRPFEGRWSERSGDSRVAYVETQRELRADCPNESLALKCAFAGSARDRACAEKTRAAKSEQARALRERFAAFRNKKNGGSNE